MMKIMWSISLIIWMNLKNLRSTMRRDMILLSMKMTNPTPINIVALEKLFYRRDATKWKEEKNIDSGEFIKVNIGTVEDMKIIKIGIS